MRLKSHYHQITDLLSSQSYKHRSSQGDEDHHHHQEEEEQRKTIPRIIKNRWSIETPISSGSFGWIYQGMNLITKEKIAIKFERKTARHAQLHRESRIYRTIEGPGMPKMYW